MDGEIHPLIGEIERAVIDEEDDAQGGIAGLEARETRHQPETADGRDGAKPHDR